MELAKDVMPLLPNFTVRVDVMAAQCAYDMRRCMHTFARTRTAVLFASGVFVRRRWCCELKL